MRLPLFASLLIAGVFASAAEAQVVRSAPGKSPVTKSALTKTPGVTLPPVAPAPPPPHDNCATPVAIAGVGTFGYDTTNATTGSQGQTEAPCLAFATTGISGDLWYAWTATFTGAAQISTCVAGNLDSKIALYPGAACPGAGTSIACDDDGCGIIGGGSQVIAAVTSGNVYMIQIGQYPGALGGISTFDIAMGAALPPNDDCSTPTAIAGLGNFPYDNSGATTGTQGQTEGNCLAFGTTGIDRDLWYAWTSPLTGTIAVSTCNAGNLDSKIAVYPGSSCPTPGTALGCDDDGCGVIAGGSNAVANVTAGSVYMIQIGQYPTSVGGPSAFDIGIGIPPPAHDDCATPMVLVGPGPYPHDNTQATTGSQGQNEVVCQPFAAGPAITFDMWFTWTASMNGTATVTTCGGLTSTAQDSKCAVYVGAGCPTTPAIACNDDFTCGVASGLNTTVTFNTTCGTVYTIQLGRYQASGANVGTFSVTETGGPCGPPGVPYCFGDGTGTPCPCANSGALGNGCASSVNAAGANLSSSGISSISADTIAILGTGMSNSTCLYFQGTTQLNGGLGITFGDGLRCAGGVITRLGTKTNVAGASQYPQPGDLSVSVRGNCVAGDVRQYQCWYRNSALFCIATATFNLTNGVQLTWAP